MLVPVTGWGVILLPLFRAAALSDAHEAEEALLIVDSAQGRHRGHLK